VKLGTIVVPTTIWDYPAALIIGAFGGVLGAFYIWLNLEVNKIRKKFLTTKLRKIIETVTLAFVTSTVFFWIPDLYGKCYDIPENLSESTVESLN